MIWPRALSAPDNSAKGASPAEGGRGAAPVTVGEMFVRNRHARNEDQRHGKHKIMYGAHIMYENMDACTQRTKLRCCPAAIGARGAGSELSIPSRSLHGLDGGWKWRDDKKMITSNSDCRVLHNMQNRYGTDVCYENCYRPWALRVDDMTRQLRIAHEHSAWPRPLALDDGLPCPLEGGGGSRRRRWRGGSSARLGQIWHDVAARQ